MEKTNKRLVNLDLLKVVAMMMIVCWHYLLYGGILEKATQNDANYYLAWFVDLLCAVGVNCFILCSGYLMTENRFRFSKMINIWFQILPVNIAGIIIAAVVGQDHFTAGTILNIIIPISFGEYWYISAYFVFYLLSPLLLWTVNKLSTEQLKKLTIALVIIFSVNPFQWTKIQGGYDFVWFCVLFFVAAYIRRADLFKKRVRVYIGRYLILTLVLLVIRLIVDILIKRIEVISVFEGRNYNFLITFLSSLMLFAAFKNIRIKKEKIAGMTTFLSSLTLGVYLIHENTYLRNIIWAKVLSPLAVFDTPYFVLHMIVCVLAVFFICAFLEYFRQLLFKLFGVPRLCDKLGAKAQTLADKVLNTDVIEKL